MGAVIEFRRSDYVVLRDKMASESQKELIKMKEYMQYMMAMMIFTAFLVIMITVLKSTESYIKIAGIFALVLCIYFVARVMTSVKEEGGAEA